MKVKILVLLSSLFLFLQTKSQEIWTFDKCLQYALEHNIQLNIQQSNSKVNQVNYQQSVANVLPSAGAYANHNFDYGKTLNQADYSYVTNNQSGNIGLNVELLVFNGFQDVLSIFRNKYMYKSGLQEVEKVKVELTINLLNTYLKVLIKSELTEALRKQYETSKEQTQRVSVLYEQGTRNYKDLLDMKAAEALDKERLQQSNNELNVNYLALTQLMNYDSSQFVNISKPSEFLDTTLLSSSFEDIYLKSETQLPYIKSAEWQLKVSKKDFAMAIGQASPTLSVGWQYGSWYSQVAANPNNIQGQPALSYPFRNQLTDNGKTQLYINLNIPIFDKFSRTNNIRKAKIKVQISESQLEQTRQQLRKDLQKLYTDSQNAWLRYNTKKETLDAMEQLYKYSEQRFGMGLLSAIEYKLNKNSYETANAEYIQAKYEAICLLKTLDYYINGSLKV